MASFWDETALRLLTPYLEEIASLLTMFPVLECIMFPTLSFAFQAVWQENRFRTAMENCLHLPTLQEVHVGDMSFPLSMLNNLANINYLALSGPPKIESQCLETTFPQIKSLALQGFEHRSSSVFRTWAKRHIIGLQSLKYDLSCYQIILDVFKICSDTLENLCLCFRRQGTPRKLSSRLAWHRAEILDLGQVDLIDLSSLSHLRHLTIHVEIFFWYDDSDDCICSTYLPKAVEILETVSSLHQLTIEIYVDPANLNKIERIDLSPLGVLTKSSVCFPHIDLYMYTGAPWCCVTPTIMDSLLAKHKGLMELVELGVLAVHPEETAPTLSRSYIAKENNNPCIIM